MPWKKLERCDLAPLSIFALLRTISEIIGRPPKAEAIVLPMPVASRSLFMSLVRFSGSNESTAETLSRDSMLPTSANMMMYLMETALKIAEKSGKAMELASEPGSRIRKLGPTWNR